MSDKYIYKLANIEEIYSLTALYKSAFNLNILPQQLRWLYAESPLLNGTYYNFIAVREDGMIVGHNAYWPVNYILNGTIIKGAYSLGSMTLGGVPPLVFPRMLKELEDQLKLDGFDLLLGFANPNSFPFFVNYFDFKESYFEFLSIQKENIVYTNDNLDVKQLLTDCYYNELGQPYIDWRINKNAFHRYEFYENDNIKIIYKSYKDNEIDILSINFKSNKFNTKYLRNFFLNLRHNPKINIYSTNVVFSNNLKNCGFSKIEVKNRFVFKYLSDNIKLDYNFLQMIDSDVF